MAKHVEFESGNILDLLNIEYFFKYIFCSNLKNYARELENSIELC